MRRSREVKRYITKRINGRLEWKGTKGYLQVYNRGKKVRPFKASDSPEATGECMVGKI